MLALCHLAASAALFITKKAGSPGYVDPLTPDSYIYGEGLMDAWDFATFFPDVTSGSESLLLVMSRFILRMSVIMEQDLDKLIDAIKFRLFVLFRHGRNDDLSRCLVSWVYGDLGPYSDVDDTLARVFPSVAQGGTSSSRHRRLTLSFSGLQYVTDYLVSTLRVNSSTWLSDSKTGYWQSVDNSTWSEIFGLIFESSPPRGAQGGRFSMREDTFRAIKNHEKRGDVMECLCSYVLLEINDPVSTIMILLVTIHAIDGGSRVRGIAEHFAAVARDQAVLRSLYDPATSKGYKTARTYWRNYLETVARLIDMGSSVIVFTSDDRKSYNQFW
ncbi:hypothetical protein FOZ62_030903 [Perkinsus olseni]|uniref:Uncharacterized protein n=1 Tax=Perkinsus olseni TaxID=32597 RepID=A0A7J6T0D9_PEROL|nr:hypothetical protein FOZ62_030903 [Perkinsus olseni]